MDITGCSSNGRSSTRDVAAAASEADLRGVRDRYLSRKNGLIAALLKALAARAGRGRGRASASAANRLKQHVETTARRSARGALAPRAAPRGPTRSTSRCPGARRCVGHRHPLTLLRERVESIFLRMGFLIVEGPELEDDYHNFEALNMPAEHPARDMQDTLYLAAPVPVPGGRRRRRCCARTPPACRSATWRRTSRRSA